MDTTSSLFLKQAVLSCALAGGLMTTAFADGPVVRAEMPPAESVVSVPDPRLIESQTGDRSAAESRAAEQSRTASEARASQKRARAARAAPREPRQNMQSGIDHFYY